MSIPSIRTQDFIYELPQDRIAQFPLTNRHDSKLLVADLCQQKIQDRHFIDLPALLFPASQIIMNNSRVLPARLPLFKRSGGAAEIFLLDPIEPNLNPSIALQMGSPTVWNCLIGGKRIEAGDLLESTDREVQAEILEKNRNKAKVRLRWKPENMSLAAVLETNGRIPLPPYMKRDSSLDDQERYQTVYAETAGSVAAPTAGLHFSSEILARLDQRGIRKGAITLHVGAGTFKPVEATAVSAHEMHGERFEVSAETLEAVADQLHPNGNQKPLIAVGTTSLRTLESLYWLGVRTLLDQETHHLEQWEAYSYLEQGIHQKISATAAFSALAKLAKKRPERRFVATTSLMVVPGYVFSTATGLLTNFHQPGSSLILLVAAWAGPFWRDIYQHALHRDYRFLSYGDSSLLLRQASP